MGCGRSQSNIADAISINKTTLHYLDFYGNTDVLRMILAYKGITFLDNCVPMEKRDSLKKAGFTEFGDFPMLEIDGLKLVKSRAISKYLCKQYGFFPTNIIDAYWVDSLCDLKEKLLDIITKAYASKNENQINNAYKENSPFYLARFEGRLKRNNAENTFFVGKSVSLADFEVFSLMWNYYLRPEVRSKFEIMIKIHSPNLLRFVEKFFESSPKLKQYLNTRPIKSL